MIVCEPPQIPHIFGYGLSAADSLTSPSPPHYTDGLSYCCSLLYDLQSVSQLLSLDGLCDGYERTVWTCGSCSRWVLCVRYRTPAPNVRCKRGFQSGFPGTSPGVGGSMAFMYETLSQRIPAVLRSDVTPNAASRRPRQRRGSAFTHVCVLKMLRILRVIQQCMCDTIFLTPPHPAPQNLAAETGPPRGQILFFKNPTFLSSK